MITLRDYQAKAITDVRAALIESPRKHVICEAPTGSGKTILFSYLAQKTVSKGNKVLILSDRTELLTGTGGTLEKFGVKPVYIMAGRQTPPYGVCFVGMAQTLKKRINKKDWVEWFGDIDLIIIDECHKQEFNKFFECGLFDNKTVIGFSATPIRGGKQRQLGTDYDKIVHTLTVLELIDMGFLMPDMYYGSSLVPDMKGVKKNTKGDYSESDMFKRYDSPKIYDGAIEAYREKTTDTNAIVFCANIIHCVRTCKKFNDAGIPAKFLVSKMSKPTRPGGDEPRTKEDAPAEWINYYEKIAYYNEYNEAMLEYSGERKQVIKQWKEGKFKVLINAGILTTGFDFPAIETVILLRATISLSLYLQMLGRGSRPCEEIGKMNFNILDFGGNRNRLGGYRLPRSWQLFHESKAGSGVPNMKECGDYGVDKNGKHGCGDYVFASSKICPICGYMFPEKAEAKKIDLELMIENPDGSTTAVKPVNQMDYGELDMFAKANKFKSMWVVVQIYRREGEEGLKKYSAFKGYKPGWLTNIFSHIPAKVIAERIRKEEKLLAVKN